MAEGVLSKVVVWGLLILFLLIFMFAFLNPKYGLIQKVAKIALGAERFLPDEPQKEVTQDDSLPSSAISAQERFINEISQYSEQSNCLLEFSDVAGLQDTKLELINYEGRISTRIEKISGKEETGTIKLSPISIENKLQVCAINPGSFYQCSIEKNTNQCNEYTSIDSVSLSKDSVKIGENQYPYAKGILFKPQKDRICFIPLHSYTGDSWYRFWQAFTRFGCDASKSTLDDNCVEQFKKNIQTCRIQATN